MDPVSIAIEIIKALIPLVPEIRAWIESSHAAGTLPAPLAPLIAALPAKGTALDAVRAEEDLPPEYKP